MVGGINIIDSSLGSGRCIHDIQVTLHKCIIVCFEVGNINLGIHGVNRWVVTREGMILDELGLFFLKDYANGRSSNSSQIEMSSFVRGGKLGNSGQLQFL